jgi:hypothetical protein
VKAALVQLAAVGRCQWTLQLLLIHLNAQLLGQAPHGPC